MVQRYNVIYYSEKCINVECIYLGSPVKYKFISSKDNQPRYNTTNLWGKLRSLARLNSWLKILSLSLEATQVEPECKIKTLRSLFYILSSTRILGQSGLIDKIPLIHLVLHIFFGKCVLKKHGSYYGLLYQKCLIITKIQEVDNLGLPV